jgi:hypothetical protein
MKKYILFFTIFLCGQAAASYRPILYGFMRINKSIFTNISEKTALHTPAMVNEGPFLETQNKDTPKINDQCAKCPLKNKIKKFEKNQYPTMIGLEAKEKKLKTINQESHTTYHNYLFPIDEWDWDGL